MRLLKLLDDTPVVPGDVRPAYEGGAQARQILNDAEDDLRDWRPDVEDQEETAGQQQVRKTASRGSADYSRDSGYAPQQGVGVGGGDRTSYDDKDTDYVRDAPATTTTTTTTAQGQTSGGSSGAPVSQEELRGEQRSSSTLPPRQVPEGAPARSSGRSGSQGLFSVVAEI